MMMLVVVMVCGRRGRKTNRRREDHAGH